jgi:hypothetical protein
MDLGHSQLIHSRVAHDYLTSLNLLAFHSLVQTTLDLSIHNSFKLAMLLLAQTLKISNHIFVNSVVLYLVHKTFENLNVALGDELKLKSSYFNFWPVWLGVLTL